MNPRRFAPALIAALAAGCGQPDPVAIQLTVAPGSCVTSDCGHGTSGTGILVYSGDPVDDDLSTAAGRLTLYAEAPLPYETTAVVEIAFVGNQPSRVRYREVRGGRVKFRGIVSEVEARRPFHDGASDVAGHFAFVAVDGLAKRRVEGVIIPASGDAVRVEPQQERYVTTDTYVSCSGEVYIPPPPPPDVPTAPLPDDPWVPDGPDAPPPSNPSPSPDPGPGPDTEEPEGPIYVPEDGGCEGTSTEPTPSDSGCDGDDYESSSSGGCEGDDYSSSDSGGCEGDDYDSAGGGCEGDSTESVDSCEGSSMAAAPVLPRLVGSLWRLFWPLGIAGAFNRRTRRRGSRCARRSSR